MSIEQLIERIKKLENCYVLPPSGLPSIENGVMLPQDVIRFYELCGGVELYKSKDYCVEFVRPTDFVPTSPLVWDEEIINASRDVFEVKIATTWYRVVDLGDSNFVAIDLNLNKSGRCYKAFWDSYAVKDETPIIANSFTELLSRFIDNNGEHWYFMQDDFVSYGDAYADMAD